MLRVRLRECCRKLTRDTGGDEGHADDGDDDDDDDDDGGGGDDDGGDDDGGDDDDDDDDDDDGGGGVEKEPEVETAAEDSCELRIRKVTKAEETSANFLLKRNWS